MKKEQLKTPREIRTGIYEHYKGNRYEVFGVALHTETLEEMVVYQAHYGNHMLFVRPRSMFFENITIDGKKAPRFRCVG